MLGRTMMSVMDSSLAVHEVEGSHCASLALGVAEALVTAALDVRDNDVAPGLKIESDSSFCTVAAVRVLTFAVETKTEMDVWLTSGPNIPQKVLAGGVVVVVAVGVGAGIDDLRNAVFMVKPTIKDIRANNVTACTGLRCSERDFTARFLPSKRRRWKRR